MMSSKIHIPACSWTDRTSHPYRRCRIEIGETTARCWRNSENGYQLVTELKRVDADHEFDVSSLPENFAATMLNLAESEQQSRRGEPIGEAYDDPTDVETFDERLERIVEELGPRKTPYFDRVAGELTEAELIVNIAEYASRGQLVPADRTGTGRMVAHGHLRHLP